MLIGECLVVRALKSRGFNIWHFLTSTDFAAIKDINADEKNTAAGLGTRRLSCDRLARAAAKIQYAACCSEGITHYRAGVSDLCVSRCPD